VRFKGGYNIQLAGRPAANIIKMPEPQVLYLPSHSGRFDFSEICVEDGRHVSEGYALAHDPDNYGVPLIAPRAGTVRLKAAEGHIALEDISRPEQDRELPKRRPSHAVDKSEAIKTRTDKLLALGAWQFFYDAHTGALPDPVATPQAVIVSTVRLEPFLARGDVQLADRLDDFARGLEHVQSLLEYQPIYLVMPDIRSGFASRVREHIRGYAWVKMLDIPSKYPYDDFALLARRLGLKSGAGPVWAVRTEGILAVDRVLTLGKPCTLRVISVGGPAVNSPAHIEVTTGYPLQAIEQQYVAQPDVRILNGGILTGRTLSAETLGVDADCMGLTVLPELRARELFGFARPGGDRKSYANCFLSSLRGAGSESLTTGLRGEPRACVSCGFCEEVCPAGIMPHLIHKYLHADLLEEAEQARLDLCVECGLCSFVCPSKIELTKQLVNAKGLIESEKAEIQQQSRSVEDAAR
jgi:Na(+)-translocating NADH:ubiquinone oxidoreductase A subunit